MSIPLIRPPTTDESREFMSGQQPASPAVLEQLRETAKYTRKAVGGVLGTALSLVPAAAEKTSYLAANVLATPSTLLYRTGKIMSNTRAKIYEVCAGPSLAA